MQNDFAEQVQAHIRRRNLPIEQLATLANFIAQDLVSLGEGGGRPPPALV